MYNTLVGLDPIAGVPAVTFTAGQQPSAHGQPPVAYTDMIGTGLVQLTGLNIEDITNYLAAAVKLQHTPAPAVYRNDTANTEV